MKRNCVFHPVELPKITTYDSLDISGFKVVSKVGLIFFFLLFLHIEGINMPVHNGFLL